MAIPKRGSRTISVDGESYLWRIRRRPTYDQANAWTPLTIAVQAINGSSILVIWCNCARPDNWVNCESFPVTPKFVSEAIRKARSNGWNPSEAGPPFEIQIDTLAGKV